LIPEERVVMMLEIVLGLDLDIHKALPFPELHGTVVGIQM